jgi:hypothetical protein
MSATVSTGAWNEAVGSVWTSDGRVRKNLAPEYGIPHMTIVVLVFVFVLVLVFVFVLVFAVLAEIIASRSPRVRRAHPRALVGIAPIELVLQSLPLPVGSTERAGLAAASHVASYVLMLAVVTVNRRVHGAVLMATGLIWTWLWSR